MVIHKVLLSAREILFIIQHSFASFRSCTPSLILEKGNISSSFVGDIVVQIDCLVEFNHCWVIQPKLITFPELFSSSQQSKTLEAAVSHCQWWVKANQRAAAAVPEDPSWEEAIPQLQRFWHNKCSYKESGESNPENVITHLHNLSASITDE